ncbi:MAG: hypothetical protein AAGH43_07930 [Pseudomonadota bacterium]
MAEPDKKQQTEKSADLTHLGADCLWGDPNGNHWDAKMLLA